MKKILVLASIVLMVMSGCSKNQIIETPESQKAISFELYSHKTTKATETVYGTLTKAATFPIVAYLNTTEGTAQEFFNTNLLFTAGKWNTNPTHYWPTTTTTSPATQTLSFFAYFPATGITYYKNTYPANNPTLEYTVADAANNQIDILGGSVIKATNVGGGTNAITLTMNHLLSQINFYIKGEKTNLKYKVTALTIGGALKNKGTYLYGATTPWSPSTGSENYTYTGDFNASYNNTGAALNEAFMLLPQNLGADANHITVTYSVTDENDIELLPSQARSVSLTGSWAPAMNYVYTITLKDNLNPIEYTVKVDTWTNEPGAVEIN